MPSHGREERRAAQNSPSYLDRSVFACSKEQEQQRREMGVLRIQGPGARLFSSDALYTRLGAAERNAMS